MGEQNTTNQDAYKNRQKYKGKIKELYKNFIKPNTPKQRGIDDYRSKLNITCQAKEDIIKAIRNHSLVNLLKAENTYQESRCHAFYRMIGFPVYNGVNFYNPGLDHIETAPDGSQKNISNSMKAETAIGAIELIGKISTDREAIPLDFLEIFKLNTSINASALALSGSKIRKFVAPLEKISNEPICTDKLKSSYEVDQFGQVADFKPSLLNYSDGKGNSPRTNFLKSRSHIIIPFLVDPRYSEGVNVSNMTSVPFCLSESQFKASDTVTVEAPLLETIIVNRISGNNLQGTSDQLEEIKRYIQNDPSIKDNKLVQSILNGYKLTEQQQFLEYVNIMKAMLAELIQAQKSIGLAQKEYYWIPIPAPTGPEDGLSVRPIIISEELAQKSYLITLKDYNLITSTLNKISNQTAASIGYANMQRRSVFPLSATIFNPQVNDSTGNNIYDEVKKLTEERNSRMEQAGNALQITEMIMGEFSGLGLCDILAIIASLYIMPIDKLIGFLDHDAFARMKFALNVPDAVRESNLEVCLIELANKVTEFYNLMDKLYEDFSKNNGLI